MAHTHLSKLIGTLRTRTIAPTDPKSGDMYYDADDNALYRYNGSAWLALAFETTTSTSSSTSTTTTSTSTTTTSTSTTVSTTTSTSTSTSTTTTV